MYKITVNGRKPLGDTKEYADEGEAIEIMLPAVTDVSMYVTSDKTEVRFDRYEAGFLYYRFIMPASDVDVNVRTESTMIYKGPREPLMGQGFHSMSDINNKPLKYCENCGAVIQENYNYCCQCGNRIKQ